jgi:DNA polymerase-4
MFVSCPTPILHADVDAFFAAVEQRDDPALRGRPVIVGGGVVMAASYEARAYGVRGGMGGRAARRLCPDALVVRPRFEAYVEASRAVFSVFRETAPRVQGMSMEEAFLDVGALPDPPQEVAARLRRVVHERTGLTISVGVARTKVLAKLASRRAKPDGMVVVPPGAERAFLDPLRVEQLWGVGPATATKLQARGLQTVGQLAALDERDLVAILGRASGAFVHALAHGRDTKPVQGRRRRRSFGAQRAIGRGWHSPQEIDAALVGLVDRVTGRMRGRGRVGRTVTLRLRFGDYTRATRSRTLAYATAAPDPLLAALRELLALAMPEIQRRGLTLVGITVDNLDGDGGLQLALPVEEP